jgi:hypothetical protein
MCRKSGKLHCWIILKILQNAIYGLPLPFFLCRFDIFCRFIFYRLPIKSFAKTQLKILATLRCSFCVGPQM